MIEHGLSFPGLTVVPYVPGRLVFAQLAATAIEKGTWDCVVVDLPRFLHDPEFLDIPLRLFPLVTALLIQNKEGGCTLLPFVPTDAALIAAWLARRHSIELECVDAPGPLHARGPWFQPRLQLEDDYLAVREGVEAYFRPIWPQMEAAWLEAPPEAREVTLLRAATVAGRLQSLLAHGSKAVFVCEYRLWWSVRKCLAEARRKPVQAAPEERSAALIFEDPALLWAAGLFDDFPAVNFQFYRSLLEGDAASFDKRAALARVGDGRVPELEAAGLRPAQWLDQVRSQRGREAAWELAKALLDYPMPKAADAGDALPAYYRVTPDGVVAAQRRFELADVFHAGRYHDLPPGERERFFPPEEAESRPCWAAALRPFVTRQEAKRLGGRDGGVRWAVTADYQLHQHVCSLVREAARHSGRLGESAAALDEHTPVVFLFHPTLQGSYSSCIHDSNITQRRMEMGDQESAGDDRPAPDMVYSVFYTRNGNETVWAPHLERDRLTSLALLFTGELMGLERYAAITARPKRFQCRIPPDEDPEISGFPLSELGLAWAVKYAAGVVLAVVCPGWKLSARLRQFTGKHGVEIVVIGLDALPPEIPPRLQQMHYVSTALKRHPNREAIVRRFLGLDYIRPQAGPARGPR